MKNSISACRSMLKIIAKASLLFLAISGLNSSLLYSQDLDVPYVPTPQNVVEKMLDMADVQEGDYVIDLGSGDGRIVISAVKRGAYGHGIDIDPERIKEARENAENDGLEDKVMFLKQNIFDTDFSGASVITMYLLTSVNKKLRPQLLESLEAGTRLVSHSFNMGEWKADKKAEIKSSSSNRTHDIYYWVIPARVEGSWSWQENGKNVGVTIKQEFQEVQLTTSGNRAVSEATLSGKRLSFTLTDGDTVQRYSGRVEGNSISGMIQTYDGEEHTVSSWSASRN